MGVFDRASAACLAGEPAKLDGLVELEKAAPIQPSSAP